MTLARTLGVSYKRLSGWEPTTTYAYDSAGRVASSRPEPEWDEEQVGWMLALAEWENALCPACGRPASVCQDPMTEFRLSVPPPTRCHITTAVRRAQKQYEKSEHPEALLFGAVLRD